MLMTNHTFVTNSNKKEINIVKHQANCFIVFIYLFVHLLLTTPGVGQIYRVPQLIASLLWRFGVKMAAFD